MLLGRLGKRRLLSLAAQCGNILVLIAIQFLAHGGKLVLEEGAALLLLEIGFGVRLDFLRHLHHLLTLGKRFQQYACTLLHIALSYHAHLGGKGYRELCAQEVESHPRIGIIGYLEHHELLIAVGVRL